MIMWHGDLVKGDRNGWDGEERHVHNLACTHTILWPCLFPASLVGGAPHHMAWEMTYKDGESRSLRKCLGGIILPHRLLCALDQRLPLGVWMEVFKRLLISFHTVPSCCTSLRGKNPDGDWFWG